MQPQTIIPVVCVASSLPTAVGQIEQEHEHQGRRSEIALKLWRSSYMRQSFESLRAVSLGVG